MSDQVLDRVSCRKSVDSFIHSADISSALCSGLRLQT